MKYQNITTALYCVIESLEDIDNWEDFEKDFAFIQQYVNIDKVYIETFRRSTQLSEDKLLAVKKFFSDKGINTSGGITTSRKAGEHWQFASLCYSDPKYMNEIIQIIKFTAKHFDEIILDDFYFTNCKCNKCIKEKGKKSWSDFRTQQLKEVSEILVCEAKKTSPDVKMIIKFPNWYDEYHRTGYNLQDEPEIFDYLYTGTETRDPSYTQQNLPRYLSYFIMRYIENVKPGKNNGGWFDPFDCSYNLNSYLEQSYLTMFAKAREITLFCMHALVGDFTQFVPLAGYSFRRVDAFLDKLGNPCGLACYKPFHSSGENYLFPVLGMLGLPLEPYPYFPEEENIVLLTQSAAHDTGLIEKIKKHLSKGKKIIITSGLAQALQGKGLEDIIELTFTGSPVTIDRMAIDYNYCAFNRYHEITKSIAVPNFRHNTNDSWSVITGQSNENSFPVLLRADYSEGELIILTIPEKFSDIYLYPEGALNAMRKLVLQTLPVYLSAPSKIGIFLYDNDTFIVESFLPYNSPITIIIKQENVAITDLENGRTYTGQTLNRETRIDFNCRASTFNVFKIITK